MTSPPPAYSDDDDGAPPPFNEYVDQQQPGHAGLV